MANICIIPARGGSKRIPNKNIKSFLGKPIIAYSIETALKSGLFDEVMVSTNDIKIADVAISYGASVPFFRSKENSSDFSTTAEVIEEVIKDYGKIDRIFENACCIYPTAPLASIKSIREGVKRLEDLNLDTVFSIVKFEYPIWRGLRKNNEGKIEMVWPENLTKRSQDLEPVYHDAGQWYWVDVKRFLSVRKLFSSNSSGIELPSLEVQDIDDENDWRLAELKYAYIQSLK